MRHLYRLSNEGIERFVFLLRPRDDIDNLEKLQAADTYVTKIGGDNAGSLRENYERIQERNEEGKKQVVVVSAIRSSDGFGELRYEGIGELVEKEKKSKGFNTTSHLIGAAKLLERGDKDTAGLLVYKIEVFTKAILEREVESEFFESLSQVVESGLSSLRDAISDYNIEEDDILEIGSDWLIRKADGSIFSIAGIGEKLASDIYQAYFQLKKLNSSAVHIGDDINETAFQEELEKYRHEEEESEDETKAVRARIQEAEARVVERVKSKVAEVIDDSDIIVTGGYAPIIASQRGYSDKMGAYMAQVAKEVTQSRVAYLVEKEFPIMSGDPRIIEWARVVLQMTYDFAEEVFGSKYGADAGAVQEEALDILSRSKIEAFVFNPNRMEAGRITRISTDYKPNPNGVEMVARKNIPRILQIKSGVMNEEGVVDIFTQWFREHKVRIDHIATSSNTISFTFNNGDFSDEKRDLLEVFLEAEYPERFRTRLLENQSLIYCMGNDMGRPGVAAQATLGMLMGEANIHLITQGVNERVMVFSVDEEDAETVLKNLHQSCVELSLSEVQLARWVMKIYLGLRSQISRLIPS